MVSVEKNWGGVEGMHLYTFESKSGLLKAKVTNMGVSIVSLEARRKDGTYQHTSLGYDSAQEWQKGSSYFGCTVGRFGNRIKQGKFTLDGKEITLTHCNNGANHLHGGVKGFDKLLWESEVVDNAETGVRGVKCTLVSPDGDNGYPGELKVESWLLIDANDELLFSWEASVTKAKTVLNLTNHTYWNLGKRAADGAVPTIEDHTLQLNADRYVDVNDESIPSGKLPPVDGTCFDFRKPTRIGDRVDDPLAAPQLGYDHAFVFPDCSADDAKPKDGFDYSKGGWSSFLKQQGELSSNDTGLGFKLFTTQPSVQGYCGNFLNPESEKGYGQVPIVKRGGLCLECQHLPDSPNRPEFPTTTLAPGEKYHHVTVHKFYAK
ncbi:Aldose 1-epimerase [Diplonema papillatum]|nr:Aldose 1-epimerase [Diplonema papillatum]